MGTIRSSGESIPSSEGCPSTHSLAPVRGRNNRNHNRINASSDIPETGSMLVDYQGKPVVILKIFKTVKRVDEVPEFTEGEIISGSVDLNLSKTETVEDAVVSVRGSILSQGKHQHRKVFVEVSERIWEASAISREACSVSSSGVCSAQLKGCFGWAFSLKLPNQVFTAEMGSRGQESSEQLPPTINFPDLRYNIVYEVVCTIKGRRTMTLSSPFNYIPMIRTPQLASVSGLDRFSSSEDEWEVFESFNVRGVAFATYTCDIKCTIALSKPLSYKRGGSIPCVIAFECDDTIVLELISCPQVPRVRLCCHVDDTIPSLETKLLRILDHFKVDNVNQRHVATSTWRVLGTNPSIEDRKIINLMRPSLDFSGKIRPKILVGEIPLSEDLIPSFSFGTLSYKYEVQMHSFKIAGFAPEDGEKAIFFRAEVQVTTKSSVSISSRQRNDSSPSTSNLNIASSSSPPSLKPHPIKGLDSVQRPSTHRRSNTSPVLTLPNSLSTPRCPRSRNKQLQEISAVPTPVPTPPPKRDPNRLMQRSQSYYDRPLPNLPDDEYSTGRGIALRRAVTDGSRPTSNGR